MRTLPAGIPVSTPTNGMGSVKANAARTCRRLSPGLSGAALATYLARCSGVPRSCIGASPRLPARLPVAAPASTHDNSKAMSASARFFGPAMNPPCSGSRNAAGDAALVEVGQKARFVRRPFVRIAAPLGNEPGHRPARYAAGALHEHLQFVALGKAPHDLSHLVARQRVQRR